MRELDLGELMVEIDVPRKSIISHVTGMSAHGKSVGLRVSLESIFCAGAVSAGIKVAVKGNRNGPRIGL